MLVINKQLKWWLKLELVMLNVARAKIMLTLTFLFCVHILELLNFFVKSIHAFVTTGKSMSSIDEKLK